MDILVWVGTGLAILGMVGVFYSMFLVARAKRAKLSDEDLRKTIQKTIPLNLGMLFVSMIGLMMVVVGAMLG